MIKLGLKTRLVTGVRVQARIKLARLLGLSEEDFASRIQEVEANPLFARLAGAGVLHVQPHPDVRFASRALDGRHLQASEDSLGDLIDAEGEFARLMRKVGQDRFEACFMGEASSSDAERAALCGISVAEARKLREFLDQLYVRSEFQAATAAPSKVYSAVAGIAIDAGRPEVAFFNREIWKGRYRLDDERYAAMKASIEPADVVEIEQFIRQLDLISIRQTTLYRVVKAVVRRQTAYLTSGDPDKRVPLSQRELAAELQVAPSALNQLIANKSVELPWRLEAPLKALFPSRKVLLRDRLYDLAIERPNAGDDALRGELRRLYGTMLSRPTMIQYRKELGLGCAGQRQRVH